MIMGDRVTLGDTLFYPFGEDKTPYLAADHIDVIVWPVATPWLRRQRSIDTDHRP